MPERARTGCPFLDAKSRDRAATFARDDLPGVIAEITDPDLKAYFQKILDDSAA